MAKPKSTERSARKTSSATPPSDKPKRVSRDAGSAGEAPTKRANASRPPKAGAGPARRPRAAAPASVLPAADDLASALPVETAPALAADAEAGALAFADVVSGRFDADPPAAVPAEPPKRVLAPEHDAPKLHKVLAQAGLGSRLEMERLIAEGRISVNHQPAHVGQRVQYGDQVKIDGKPLRLRMAPPPPRVLAYHKPVGEVVTHDDPQHRPTVFRQLPRLAPGQGKWQSVGRLDLNTEGLLLLTNVGALANQLMHPRFGLEREYAVRVLGALSDDEKQRLLDGVQLEDGPAQFLSIDDVGGEGVNHWYRVTIAEGRNREVRRMMESLGHAVSRLIRIRYGQMLLPRGLRRGQWMELSERDVAALAQAVGLSLDTSGARAGRGPRGEPERARRGAPDRRGGPRGAGGPVARAPRGAKPAPLRGRAQAADPQRPAPGYIGGDSFQSQRKSAGAGPRGKAPKGARKGRSTR